MPKISPVYHGGNKFRKFDSSKARSPNDYYGGGVAYFTTSKEISIGYAKAALARSKGDDGGYVYTVELSFKNVFDVDDKIPQDKIKKILAGVKDHEKFARDAGLMRGINTDRHVVMARLKSGKIEMTGEQVFKGLSGGQIKTTNAREVLKKAGYDGLRYNGGLITQTSIKHDVYLAYFNNQIKITKTQRLVKKEAA